MLCPTTAPAPAPSGVGWFLNEERGGVIYDAPARVRSAEPSRRHAKSASRCPAILGLESRYFEVKCPFDLHLAFARDNHPRRGGAARSAAQVIESQRPLGLALPTGDLRASTGELLIDVGISMNGYEPGSRLLRSEADERGFRFRIFRERDIPIQVALGNYDVGICSDIWVAELQARFPYQRVVRLGSLPGPTTEVWLCAAPSCGVAAGEVPAPHSLDGVRIGTELPNFTDLFAARLRLPRYSLLNLSGSVEAYPPEDADLVVLPASDATAVEALGLVPLHRLFRGGVAVVANTASLASRDCAAVLDRLATAFAPTTPEVTLPDRASTAALQCTERSPEALRLALPDGHAQRHTHRALSDAGITFDGYGERDHARRPTSSIPGLEVKVVRPQDMPQLVARGAFDIAISGVDRLREHLALFPLSPVEMALDLGRSKYRIGPIVHNDFPATTTDEALAAWSRLGRPVRIASEFPGLAEEWARDHRLPHTAIILIAGASEGFVPEDADILVEGVETGTSLRVNNLRMLDPFLHSTNCVIVGKRPPTTRPDLLADLLSRLRAGVQTARIAEEQEAVASSPEGAG